MDKRFKYRGFISYSRQDQIWGRRLHRWLETYRIPDGVIAGVRGPTRLGRFFRDDEEMSAAADIAVSIRQAIEDSESLIVLCSPRSAHSNWVDAEIRQFRRTGRGDKVFAVIIDGVPNSADPASECFPPAMRTAGDPNDPAGSPIEPLGLDVRKEGRLRTCARLAAGVMDVDFDDLWQRDRRRAAARQKIVVGGLAALSTVFAVLAASAIRFALEADLRLHQVIEGQMRLLTQTAAERLKDGDVAGAQGIIHEVLASPQSREARSAAAINVFQEARAADTQLVVLSGHRASVLHAVFSPNGRRVVTASNDKTARIWDAASGEQLTVLLGHESAVISAVYSPDGRRVVTTSHDKTARIWVAATGKQLAVLSGHESDVNSAAYSPDGRTIVTASTDKTARIWDAISGKQLRLLLGHESDVNSAAYSPDGRTIVTASADKTARIWDAASGKQLAALTGHESGVESAAYSPDGQTIVTASADKTARIWDAASGKQLAALTGHDGYVFSAAFSPDGRHIITASADKTARIWDSTSGKQLAVLTGHESYVVSAVYSPDGRTIVTASYDKTARIWDAARGKQLAALLRLPKFVFHAEYSPDGRRIVTASSDKTARIWDAVSGKQLAVLFGHESDVISATYSPDGRTIVTASDDKTARIWDAASGKQLSVLAGHDSYVYSAAFSPDGRTIVTASDDKTARIWDTTSGKTLGVFSGHGSAINSAGFSPDGRHFVTSSNDKTARIWEAASGKQLAVFSGHEGDVNSAAYSPDGWSIVTASSDMTARIWDTTSGKQLRVLVGHESDVNSAVYSPDGRYIVTASDDKTARIWDAANGEELAVLSGHGDFVGSAAYSPDGRRIVTTSDDRTARIWDAHVPAGLDAQIAWSEAAQIDPLSEVERTHLGLPRDTRVRTWPDRASPCDISVAAPFDPDRRARGVVQTEIGVDIAGSVCAGEIAKAGHTPRLVYQMGRALLARHDLKNARSAFADAVSRGYRAAQIDLANLLIDPAAAMLDPARAIALYENAWRDGVSVAAFDLGQLYEFGLHGAGTASRISFRADPTKAWTWYRMGADVGEPNALARFGEKDDSVAVSVGNARKKDALLLDAFRHYAAAAELARDEDWPDDAWKNWRHRRATLARLLARRGMMEEVAAAFGYVRDKWKPPASTWLGRFFASLGFQAVRGVKR